MLLPRTVRRILLHRRVIAQFHTSSVWFSSRKVLQKFKLADIGEGITECEVISWNVKLHSTVQAFDPLCEVQSDKASVEITSPFDGIIKELLVKEGQVARVGEVLCLIEVDEEILGSVDSAAIEPVGAPPPHEQDAAATSSSAHAVSSSEQPPSYVQEKPEQSRRRLHPLDPNNTTGLSSAVPDVLATPSVRHFARHNNVHLAAISPGSGKDGRVEKRDVEAFLAKSTSGARESSESRAPAASALEEDVVIELGRTRYGMWKAMVKSLEIPHFGYTTTLDLTTLHNLLPILNQHIPIHYLPPLASPTRPLSVSPSALFPAPSPPPVPPSGQYTRITYLPILLKTLSKAMIEWPLLRSSIRLGSADSPQTKPTMTLRPHADISIALSTPTGLYTPTIASVDTHSVYSLASRLRHLAHLGRQTPCGLTPAEMPRRGGTLTVSNVGAIGAGDSAMPVLVPGGGVAIVAIGRAKWVWDVDRGNGNGERRLKVGVSWSADHRVVEGAELAAFVECWRSFVEQPERLIAEGV